MDKSIETKKAYVHIWHPAYISDNVDIEVHEIDVIFYENQGNRILYKRTDEKTLIPEVLEHFIDSNYIDKAFVENYSYKFVMYSFKKCRQKEFIESIIEHYKNNIKLYLKRIKSNENTIEEMKNFMKRYDN